MVVVCGLFEPAMMVAASFRRSSILDSNDWTISATPR
jgi:hypothetical protein